MDFETLPQRVRTALDACRQNVASFLALPETTPASAVLEAFDALTSPLNGPSGHVGLAIRLHPDAALRESCEELQQEIAALGTEISLRREVYDRLVAVDPDALGDRTERRLLDHSLRHFRRSGVDRDEATRERIRKLREELVEIGQTFDRNIVLGGRDYVVEDGHAGLAGLPQDFLAAHPEREDGTVVVSSDPADRMAVLSFAEREDVRNGYYRTALNRAVPENLEVLPRLLAKRHELAQLLGFEHWADYVTEDQMTKQARNATDFVDRVVALVRARAADEARELAAWKHDGSSNGDAADEQISEADQTFLLERVKRERFAVDARAVRAYFPYERVRDGVLSTSAELYGVTFRRMDVPLWHESVEAYEVVDDGQVVARFYLDMHPRDGKFKHAAMLHVVEGSAEGPLPEAALACNFPAPREGDAALLLHDQVTTFFHEFGHLLHHLFGGRQRFVSFSGISTEDDFVEVPSQLYEEWAWDLRVLQRFALHHETGEPIPAETVQALRAAEEYGKALTTLRQMFYARLSLACYDRDPERIDVAELVGELKEELLVTRSVPDTHFEAGFGHLNGYSASYYTYMWSLVIAKDLFSRFEENPMDRATARDYRAKVLAPGGSKDAAELVEDFLGRPYTFDSFERWLAS